MLHAAGIEVILGVVYNHTAEGNHLGPMLAFRGIDNPTYYRLTDDPRFYIDHTRTGNSLNPHVLQPDHGQLALLGHREMHVDGFRFDLAALARELHDVDRLSAFFDLIQRDPVISRVKLIAEPWDVGEGGYQVGNFPPLWSEWNGKDRDTVRDFFRGADQTLAEFAFRFTGSPDLYELGGPRPYSSVNFITRSRISSRTITSATRPTARAMPTVRVTTARGTAAWRDLPTTRTSSSCADARSETSSPRSSCRRASRCCSATTRWAGRSRATTTGTARTSPGTTGRCATRTPPSWRSRPPSPTCGGRTPSSGAGAGSSGAPSAASETKDIAGFKPDGREMSDEDWNAGFAKSNAVYLNGKALPDPDPRGERIEDDTFLILFNAHHEPIRFVLPGLEWGPSWRTVIDTYEDVVLEWGPIHRAGAGIEAASRSVMLLHLVE